MKRADFFRGFIATLCLCFFGIQTSFAALDEVSPNQLFRDIAPGHIYAEAISYIKFQNIVHGYPDGTFQPDQTINLAEFSKIVTRSRYSETDINACVTNHIPSESSVVFFNDVPKNSWYAPYVCMMKVKNLLHGYPDGTLKPWRNISLGHATRITATSFDFNIPTDTPWYKPFESWYLPYIDEIGNRKAIPTSANIIEKNITRGEMSEMVYRLKAQSILQKNYNTAHDYAVNDWNTYVNTIHNYQFSYPLNAQIESSDSIVATEADTVYVLNGSDTKHLLKIHVRPLREVVDQIPGVNDLRDYAEYVWDMNRDERNPQMYLSKVHFAHLPSYQFSVNSGFVSDNPLQNETLDRQYIYIFSVKDGNLITTSFPTGIEKTRSIMESFQFNN